MKTKNLFLLITFVADSKSQTMLTSLDVDALIWRMKQWLEMIYNGSPLICYETDRREFEQKIPFLQDTDTERYCAMYQKMIDEQELRHQLLKDFVHLKLDNSATPEAWSSFGKRASHILFIYDAFYPLYKAKIFAR